MIEKLKNKSKITEVGVWIGNRWRSQKCNIVVFPGRFLRRKVAKKLRKIVEKLWLG